MPETNKTPEWLDALKTALIALLDSFFGKMESAAEKITPTQPVVVNPKPIIEKKPDVMFRNKLVLLKAASQLGVKEVPGDKDNPKIVEYQKYSTVKNLFGWADSVPWCATFVCWVLETVGMSSTNSASARSYENWGVSSKADPLPGDIVVFWRDTLASGKGHVTIFLKKKGDMLYCLGGNQSDSVCISAYSPARLRDIRRSSLAGAYSEAQVTELKTLADEIMAGKKFDTSGKVV